MSLIRETCGCGAEWEGQALLRAEADKFREAHAACRTAGNEQEPEGFEHCKRCGRGNAIWSASSPLWNAVMRGGSIDGEPKYGDLVCASCFMELAEEQGIASHFRVVANQVDVELETTTPSGRVWDEGPQLWVRPPAGRGRA